MVKPFVFLFVVIALWLKLLMILENGEGSKSNSYSLSLHKTCEDCELDSILASDGTDNDLSAAEFLAFVGDTPKTEGPVKFVEMSLILSRPLPIFSRLVTLCVQHFNPSVIDEKVSTMIPLQTYQRLFLPDTAFRVLFCDGEELYNAVPNNQLGFLVGTGTVHSVKNHCSGGPSIRHEKNKRERNSLTAFKLVKCKLSC